MYIGYSHCALTSNLLNLVIEEPYIIAKIMPKNTVKKVIVDNITNHSTNQSLANPKGKTQKDVSEN